MRVALSGLVFVFVHSASIAHACMLVADKPIAVAGEEVLLVWDQEAQSEQLIRYIDFRGEARDFGFVVPTPSKPSIRTLRSRSVFETLSGLYRRSSRGLKGVAEGSGVVGREKSIGGVEVVSRVSLPAAGQTATILAADDAGALYRWLSEHGYPSNPRLEAYYQPYVERGFFFTAFRYIKGADRRTRGAVVSLSFKTEQLFFPYAEPRGNKPSRPFRLSVLAKEPVSAQLGAKPWGAKIGFRGPISTHIKYQFVSVMEARLPGDRWFVTTFDEPRSRRGGVDLVFSHAPETKPVAGSLKTIIGARADYVN
ncbi:MAG: DUF2330 domain-containing protein [Myxococcota bacterium]